MTVTGTTPFVETTTSDLGETIDQTQINNLPVNGRLAALVMQLAPGTTPAAWGAGNPEDASGAASTAPGGGGGGDYTSANGFPFEGNLYLVDGVSNVELMNAYMGIQIPFAMISEMKLETSDPTAEYGTFGGMVSNITTKSPEPTGFTAKSLNSTAIPYSTGPLLQPYQSSLPFQPVWRRSRRPDHQEQAVLRRGFPVAQNR